MWIVRLALRRPYTVAVMSMLIFVMGILSLSRMDVDIFPAIDIPVVIVVWNYPGLSPEDMERRIVLISERAYSTTVNGIERIESQSIPSVGMLKVYFHPGTSIGAAIAQIASVSGTLLRIAPPGLQPPIIIKFNASNVPVAQLTVSSPTMPEQEIFDYGLNFIRVRLFTIPGLSTPAPFGGRTRQISVDIKPAALSARGLSLADVVSALQASNVILPAGTARMGDTEYNVLMNSSPSAVEEFKHLPVKVVGNAVVYLGDVANVEDSYMEQTNIVRVNGRRATYLAILKHADASTLSVIESTKKALPLIKEVAPQGIEIKVDFDQSIFVRAAINGVIREAVLASLLVSVMILVFLGSWRSMVIVVVSIPLSILIAIVGLNLTGNTINIMTLGGLAQAVGMLVDDATVTARYADPGALLQNAANAQTTALPLVTLSQTDRLRVYVYPDQTSATLVRSGDRAEIYHPARPELKVEGTVARTSGEVDTKTRTLLVEFEVDNSQGQVLAGSSVQVRLWVRTPRLVQVLASALIIKDDKPYVGVVTEEDRFQLRPVSIRESNGKFVKLGSGIKVGERVALNAGSTVSDGDTVQPVCETSRTAVH